MKAFWSRGNNFGDKATPLLLKEMFGVMPEWTDSPRRRRNGERVFEDVVVGCGSLLQWLDVTGCVVWGSGVIADGRSVTGAPKEVLAVRGPLSRQTLIRSGVQCPETYCDTMLLLSHTRQKKREEFLAALIPHYVDQKIPFFANKYDQVLLVDVRAPFDEIIDATSRCACVISSSLHGGVLADALSIPKAFVKTGEPINGGDFKFDDYQLSIGGSCGRTGVDAGFDSILRRCTRTGVDVKKMSAPLFGIREHIGA